jgi:hypothetical protein
MDKILNKKDEDIIKIYNNIIGELIRENLIGLEMEVHYPSTVKFFIETLLKYNINTNIIYNKIGTFFDLDVLSYNESKQTDYIVNDLGVIVDEVFYLKNPFSNVSRNIIEKHKEYAFFEKIGIIKEIDYQKIMNYKLEDNNSFSSEYFLINIIEKAINKNVTEIFIPYNSQKVVSDIIFNFNNNYFTIEDKYRYSELPSIEKVLTFNKKDYYIKTKTIEDGDNKLFFLYINEYKVERTIESFDKKYKNKILEMLTSSSGLFLMSEKNESDLYYIFLQTLKSKTNKKIISIENEIQAKIDNVFQTKNIINGNDLSLFDVVFVKNVSTKEQIQVIVEALQLGKLVLVSTVSQDSLIALSSLISNFDIDKYLLSEKIIGVYHSTILPEVCEYCSDLYPIKESEIINEEAFSAYKMSIDKDQEIRKAHKEGCSNCLLGYSGGVVASELLTKDKDVATEIEKDFNIRELRNLKESKRWETVYSYSRYLVERQHVCINDVKNIL